jgi:hypothetical protein
MSMHYRMFYSYMTSQQRHIYKYVHSHIIILQQHVSFTPVTNIRVPYNKNTVNIKELYKTKLLAITFWLCIALPVVTKCQIVLSFKISLTGCLNVVHCMCLVYSHPVR